MANVEFGVYSKKVPMNLNIRFYHNKIDVNAKTNIFVFDTDFKYKKIAKGKKSTRSIEVTNDSVKTKTEKLKKNVYDKFIEDFPRGTTINSDWLVKIINEFHERPDGESDPKYFLIPLFDLFIADSKIKINTVTGEPLAERTITRYEYTKKHIVQVEEHFNKKIRISEVDLDFCNEFIRYHKEVSKYANTTINKSIKQIKQVLNMAVTKGIKVNPEIGSDKFTIKKDETIDTYLNESEIDIIFSHDLSGNDRLDKVRDLFIAGLWTGLRISDLKRINSFDISNNRIKIIELEKTNSFVEIPIHPQLKKIIEKREGVLPEITDQKFNLYVKELCELVGIDEIILGGLKNPDTNRKEKGYYPKFKLIASHTCRRSFVSNHYGKLDDKTIMAITGHKSHSQFLDYVKISKREHAEMLENYWNEQEETKKSKRVQVKPKGK